MATTLLDPQEAPAGRIADLFRARWHAELHLRSLKVILGMDVLRCKTPEMVRKELWLHLLVYESGVRCSPVCRTVESCPVRYPS
ncbi:MAG TPA: transposase [Pirellulales bacterium]|nr:transposase [Pirellulales bacterium]